MASGSRSPELSVRYDPVSSSWKTCGPSLIGDLDLTSSLLTLPASGSMRSGRVFERPTSAPPTSAGAGSSSPGLPTPRARDSKGRGYEDGLPATVELLLPTPTASDTNGTGPADSPRNDTLRAKVALLPTPTMADGDRSSATYTRGNPTLTGALLPTPRVSATRTSRGTMLRQSSSPSLEQAIELTSGILPRELTSLDEAPASWRGAFTSPPSDDGSAPSDAQHPAQLTIEDALLPSSSNG